MKEAVQNLFREQLTDWKLAKDNYEALSQAKTNEFKINYCTCKVQFNPARITSSAAKVDAKSIQQRPCFLCGANRPTEQKGVPFAERYTILVNPYPIFPRHLTIPYISHSKQLIKGRFADMLNLAKELDEYIVFYNGPKSGASAPDHLHFQAGNKGFLPIEKEWSFIPKERVVKHPGAILWRIHDTPRATFVIESDNLPEAEVLFNSVYNALELKPEDEEPMMNILAWYEKGIWITCIFPREKHRPDLYFAEGDKNLLISPASVDLGGMFISPLEKDFNKITSAEIKYILNEVCVSGNKLRTITQQIKSTL
ncbi:DUF4922 domain-containing protein [Bacteroides sp. 224]|uniref:DUF4922 domain-containing protein n=1 Tax=Bacteroides sp. 224 TaxID=2302936 RepID=UPI001DB00378|nr:DUF4922 domain-containing protein [Bacteroides sp. 224]